MSVETMHTLRISRVIRADRTAVWNAWTQPEEMKKWSCPAPGGAHDVVSDFRVGGAYSIVMRVDGNEHTAFGTYREIDEPNRVVYTWDWKEDEHQVGETLVTVEFEDADGGTRVILTHEGFPTPEAKEAHGQGWTGCFQHLEALFS